MAVADAAFEGAAPGLPAQAGHASPGGDAGERGGGYAQILKSTALVGGASALNIAFGLARTKAMALLLGPAGVGIWGLYNSIVDLAFTLAGMGVQSSAVRQIAESAGSGDQVRIGQTIVVLRRLVLLLGFLGAGVLVLASGPISLLTFGTRERAVGVAVVAIAVLLRIVAGGQGALLQGLRRVPDMAKMSVIGGLLGTVSCIPLVYFLREGGILPALVASTGLATLASWWYCRRIPVVQTPVPLGEFIRESAGLLKLGFAFLISGFVMMGTAYAVRVIILRTVGFEATGLYQSAWTLCGLYVGFILQSMGADFYPRLTASAHDREAMNRLVNEQAKIAVLLGGPGAMATLTLAPLVIFLFYSSSFTTAVGLLRWLCLGVALRLIIWPMGFIPIARARQIVFVLTDVTWGISNVVLTSVFIGRFGLDGAGMAFFGAYLINGLVIYAVVRRITGFRWSGDNLWLISLFVPAVVGVFAAVTMLPVYVGTTIGLSLSLASAVFSLRNLVNLVPHEKFPGPVIAMCVKCRLITS